jgi:hypothetical protein
MNWIIIVSMELLLIAAIILLQIVKFRKAFQEDRSLQALRELQHDAMIDLFNAIEKEEYIESEAMELRKFVEVLDTAIENFDQLKIRVFSKEEFKQMFRNLADFADRNIVASSGPDPKFSLLKTRFYKAMAAAC